MNTNSPESKQFKQENWLNNHGVDAKEWSQAEPTTLHSIMFLITHQANFANFTAESGSNDPILEYLQQFRPKLTWDANSTIEDINIKIAQTDQLPQIMRKFQQNLSDSDKLTYGIKKFTL